MPTLIPAPTRVSAAGNKPKVIEEFVGRVNSKTAALSIALDLAIPGCPVVLQKPGPKLGKLIRGQRLNILLEVSRSAFGRGIRRVNRKTGVFLY